MDRWILHPTLVEPFYLHLMNGNIVTITPTAEQIEIFSEFRKQASIITDQNLKEMLNATWRPAKVAPWFIAYGMRTQFKDEIEQHLLAKPYYAEQLIICLARFKGSSATNALLSYLAACSKGQFQTDRFDERISPEWARYALEYLGSNTSAASELWESFLKREAFMRPHWEKRYEDV